MKPTFYSEFVAAAKQGPRLFFAPLIGAINAVRDELQRISPSDKEARAKTVSSAARRDGRR